MSRCATAHVGLVDAHAEGDGGHHHHAVFAQSGSCCWRRAESDPRGRPARGGAGPGQGVGNFHSAFARLAVHDGPPACSVVMSAKQLAVAWFSTMVADVGPVKALTKCARPSLSRSIMSCRVRSSAWRSAPVAAHRETFVAGLLRYSG
jgi:hypothetical protein